MEELCKTIVPRGRIHAIGWSAMNLLAVSVSVETEGYVAENREKARFHQLTVMDPDRPWELPYVNFNCKSIVVHVDWSLDGTRLLTLDQNGVIHIFRMRGHCMNDWVVAYKQEPVSNSKAKPVHTAWLECRPMATINHGKQEWGEVMEFQPISPHIRMLLGSAFISLYSDGKVLVTSASVTHSNTVTVETRLGSDYLIVAAKTYVTPSGSVLCVCGCGDGEVRVFSLTLSWSQGDSLSLSATLATEFHPTANHTDKIKDLLVCPHPDGCIVHVCYNETDLYQWSVKDFTRSGSYQAKRDCVYTSPHPIEALAASSLCLGSCEPSPESEIIALQEVSEAQSEQRWPIEMAVTVGKRGEVVILNRDTYKPLDSYHRTPKNFDLPPTKRPKLDPASPVPPPLACFSPNAICVAVAHGDIIQLFQVGELVLGLKDSTTPEVPRSSRLFSLAVVSSQSPWDIAVVCSRMEGTKGPGTVKSVLSHFSKDFHTNSSTMRDHLLPQYLSACSLLHSSLEDGLVTSLSYRHLARLHSTISLLSLCLPSSESGDTTLPETLQGACSSNSSEESLEGVASGLEFKEFLIPPDIASQLQGHVHWIIEFSIKMVSAIATGHSASIPELSAVELLRQCLLLVYIWNKVLPHPIIPVTDGALSLLFKTITRYLQSPSTPLPEDLHSEVSSNVPFDKYPNLLTLTRAAQLQGFLSGLVGCQLPDTFLRDRAPRLRPLVQQNYTSKDPYSPLTLVVPKELTPPWRDCFIEGLRDVIHGGVLMKSVLQNARVKQCSRCRSWTVASENLQPGSEGASGKLSHTASPVQQWRNAWSARCLCGGLWALRSR